MFQAVTAHRPPFRAPAPYLKGMMPDLLSRIASERSEEAFRRLFETFVPRIRSYMRSRGADAAAAEDLAQETLLMVWRKAALYSAEKGTPASWIFTIARNLRIDRLRKEVPWQELGEDQEEIASDDAAPDELVSLRQRQERVRSVLAALPPDQREAVTLAFIEGLSHSEIAARLSLPLGTVKSRMRLAYGKVRAALEDLQ